MSRNLSIATLLVLSLGCTRNDQPGSDSTPATSSDSVSAIMLSAAQVRHGRIRWEPVAATSKAAHSEAVSTPAAAVPGQLAPDEDRTARLGAPARGRVLGVRVSPGDRVRAGQVLVTLESPDAAMAQSDLSKATAHVTAAQAQARYASSARDRAERLLALKAIPRQDYERAIAEHQLAQSELVEAEAELRRSRMTAAALSASDGPEGNIDLKAPLSGVVLERLAVPGTVVEAGTPLVVITEPAALWLVVDAPETLLGGLRAGTVLRFTVPAYPAATFTGRITAIGAGLDPAKRTLPVRATVSNASGRLKSAMVATVEIPLRGGTLPTADTSGWVVIPTDAVQLLRGATTVFVAMPDGNGGAHLMARTVEVGGRSAGRVTITSGISPGDIIVVEGAFAVKAAIEKGIMPKMEM